MSTRYLFAMGMNPNLSSEDFERLASAEMDAQKRLIDIMLANAEKMPPDQQVDYICSCLPLIL